MIIKIFIAIFSYCIFLIIFAKLYLYLKYEKKKKFICRLI